MGLTQISRLVLCTELIYLVIFLFFVQNEPRDAYVRVVQ